MPKRSCKKRALVKGEKPDTNPGSMKVLLEKWFAEPDDLGEKFWKEFEKEFQANRFSLP